MSILTRIRRMFMLSCEDVNRFLIDYLEGTLDDRTRRKFERHLEECAQCKIYLEQYKETVALAQETRSIENIAPPEELVESTLEFLQQHYDD